MQENKAKKKSQLLQQMDGDTSLFGVPKNNDDRISTKEHFADETILVDWLSLLLSFTSLRHLIHTSRTFSSCHKQTSKFRCTK